MTNTTTTRPSLAALAAALLSLACASACAAPFAQWFDCEAPGGGTVRVWGRGDEYSAVFEAEDGHTVVRPAPGAPWQYAFKDQATGALVPSGIVVGCETDADRALLATVPLHQRDTSQAAAEARARRIAEADAALGTTERWNRLAHDAWHGRRPDAPR